MVKKTTIFSGLNEKGRGMKKCRYCKRTTGHFTFEIATERASKLWNKKQGKRVTICLTCNNRKRIKCPVCKRLKDSLNKKTGACSGKCSDKRFFKTVVKLLKKGDEHRHTKHKSTAKLLKRGKKSEHAKHK